LPTDFSIRLNCSTPFEGCTQAKRRSLAEIYIERGVTDAEERALLSEMSKNHSGDAEPSLASIATDPHHAVPRSSSKSRYSAASGTSRDRTPSWAGSWQLRSAFVCYAVNLRRLFRSDWQLVRESGQYAQARAIMISVVRRHRRTLSPQAATRRQDCHRIPESLVSIAYSSSRRSGCGDSGSLACDPG
jgi:hypothetical protein